MDTTATKSIKTLHFGEINVEEKHIFTFKDGMLGFENLKQYVLISDEETVPFKWLISLDEPEIGFPLLSPWHIDLTYSPGREIDTDKVVLFVVVTLDSSKGQMSANMKAPIILDVEKQTGEQRILRSDKYSTNYLFPNKEDK
jgi:flagellar assembly factor FliW